LFHPAELAGEDDNTDAVEAPAPLAAKAGGNRVQGKQQG